MSIELLNYNSGDGEGKMTQVTPVQPEKVVVQEPEPKASSNEELDQHISLHQAARDGRIDVINYRLFKLGRSGSTRRSKALNKLDDEGVSPLHYAVRYGHITVVKLLVENGAEVDIHGPDNATPLHYAARFFATSVKVRQQSTADETDATLKYNSLEDVLRVYTSDVDNISIIGEENSIVDYLLSVNAKINKSDSYGMTPLHYAATKCNIAAVKELLQSDEIKVNYREIGITAEKFVLKRSILQSVSKYKYSTLDRLFCFFDKLEKEPDSSGATPLHAASNEGALLVVQALAKRGADIRSKDHEGMTPLHFACSEGHLDVVKYLLKQAEEKGGMEMVQTMLTDKNSEKESALHSATDGGHLGVVQLCIEKGANVRDVRTNNTQPLHLAAISGKIHIAKLLVDHGANIEARNMNHETPMHRAACFNRVDFVIYLLDQGANIESRDKDNFTPLLSAASEGHTKVVSTLLSRSANLKCEDRHNKTAIFMAAEQNCVDTLKELLNHPHSKELINKSDLYEDTPLHVAAMKGFVVVAELLLNNEAKIDARDDEEYTPLHLAAKHGRTRTVQALLKRDSSIINDEDELSNTPLHLASIEGHWKCVRELLECGSPVDARNVNLWTPLDCAAANGHVKTAAMLLDYDSPVDPTDKTQTTPLHLASRDGHVDMVQLLLSRNADIAMTDHTGRNCLDMAIDKGQKEVATAIVKDKRWMDAMKNKTLERGKVTTPMRKLILKLPDVAEIVLNQCVTDNGLPTYHYDYEIIMNYEYLEDVYSEWFNANNLSGSATDSETGSIHTAIAWEKSEFGYAMIEDETMKQAATAQLERKSHHPVTIMVKKGRETLVSHPLVTFLLARKWQKYGRFVYYLKLFIFCIFLAFLTGYSLVTTSTRPSIIGPKSQQNCTMTTLPNPAQKFFIEVGSVIVMVLACWHILMEIFQLIYQFYDYFNWENLLEWIAYTTAIVYVAPEFQESHTLGLRKCSDWHPSVGAVSIFTGWMCLLLFIRKFPKLGIYVVMFTDILYTFTKFSLIFILFIIAFALSFYTLLADLAPFRTAGRSLVKTGVMMIGEFEFDTLFDDSNSVPPVTWLLFVIFLIVMTLILMNLLIGLAVDDIKGVQDQALLKRQAMLVDLALDVEKALPRKLRKGLLVLQESYFPNRYTGIWRFFSQPLVSPQEMKEALELEKPFIQKMEEHNDNLDKGMKAMKNRMKELQSQQETLQAMLQAVVKKLEITLEDDAGDEEEHLLS